MKRCGILTAILMCMILVLGGCGLVSGDSLLVQGAEDYKNGDYTSAIDKLERAEKIGLKQQKEGNLYSIMGNCYMELDLYEEALEYYTLALETDPSSVIYIVNLAIGYRQSGEFEKAVELYEQALEIDPDYAELNSSLGTLYIFLDDAQTAVYYFEKALEQNPSLATTYGNAALAYAMLGDFETAERYLRQSRALGYENADAIEDRMDELRK